MSEPDAGMPERTEQPMLLMPIEKVSWLLSMRAPALAANDFPIDKPSSKHKRETAEADHRMVSQCEAKAWTEGVTRKERVDAKESK